VAIINLKRSFEFAFENTTSRTITLYICIRFNRLTNFIDIEQWLHYLSAHARRPEIFKRRAWSSTPQTIRPPTYTSSCALGRECTVEIDSLAMTGTIATREIHKELQWIKTNRTQLNAEWRRLNP